MGRIPRRYWSRKKRESTPRALIKDIQKRFWSYRKEAGRTSKESFEMNEYIE
jgi:hypothetical protein